MKYINQIAYHKNIRNEEPNKELAKLIIEKNSANAIEEMISGLSNKNKSISSDCMAVLYNVGYEKPELILKYYNTFLELLDSEINRLVSCKVYS